MDPELITQLRQELRKQGLSIEQDIVGYAKSINLYKGREPDKSPVAAANTSSVPAAGTQQVDRQAMELDSKKQKLATLIAKVTATGPLATFQKKFIDKIQSMDNLDNLKQFGEDLGKIIEMARKAQQAGPETSQAFTQATGTFIKQAEQKPPPQTKSMGQAISKFVSDTNKGMQSKANSLQLHEIYPNLRMYTSSYENSRPKPVNVKIPTAGSTDTAWVVGLPLQDGSELLAMGFSVARNLSYLTADAGRPSQELLGHLFTIEKGDNAATLQPAIKQADGVIKPGKVSLPL